MALFERMEVGDSVVLPRQARGSASKAAFYYKAGTAKKFALRTVDETKLRLWRTA